MTYEPIELSTVPDSVRRMILAYWIEEASRYPQTDPRWLEEAASLDAWDFDEHVNTARVVEVLTRAEVPVQRWTRFCDHMRQGADTFGVILGDNDSWAIRVSELGPAVDLFHAMGFRVQPRHGPKALPGLPDRYWDVVTAALDEDGFEVLSAECLGTVFRGLHVYCFAPAQELTVCDLLFYWQD